MGLKAGRPPSTRIEGGPWGVQGGPRWKGEDPKL